MSARHFFLIGLIALAGCSDPGWLEVVVDARDLSLPEMVDEVEVRVVASRTAGTEAGEAAICQPASRIFPEGDGLELPINVVFTQGSEEWRCMAVRVIGRREGEPVIRAEELYCPSLDETATATLWLDGACHADRFAAECDGHRVCRVEDGEAACASSSVGSLFELEPETDRSCLDEP